MPEYAPLTQIVGRVGVAPKVKTTSKGDIVEFSVAVSDGYGENAKTTWHNVAVWSPELQPKVMDEVYKGAAVCVEGPAKSRTLDNGTTSRDISAFRVGLVAWIVKGKTAKPADDGDEF